MEWIKQKTIISNNKELFDNICNEFRLQNQCIATQTNTLWCREEIMYIAVIFYKGITQ